MLRIASSVLHILSQTLSRLSETRHEPEGERQRRNISARKFPDLKIQNCLNRKRVSQKLITSSYPTRQNP